MERPENNNLPSGSSSTSGSTTKVLSRFAERAAKQAARREAQNSQVEYKVTATPWVSGTFNLSNRDRDDRGFGRRDRDDRGFGRRDRDDRGFGRRDRDNERGLAPRERYDRDGDRGFGRRDRFERDDDRGYGRRERFEREGERGFGRRDRDGERGFGRRDRDEDRGFGRRERGEYSDRSSARRNRDRAEGRGSDRKVIDVRSIYQGEVPMGCMVSLPVSELSEKGAFVNGKEHGALFIPNSQLPEGIGEGDELRVFLYKDGERTLATARRPYIELGMTGNLRVNSIENGTAYLELGIPKELVVPVSEQRSRFYVGSDAMVLVAIDDRGRIFGTQCFNRYIRERAEPGEFEENQRVRVVAVARTPLGMRAIIDDKVYGLVYESEIKGEFIIGKRYEGYVRAVRDDGRLDISLSEAGRDGVEHAAMDILQALHFSDGALPFNDRSEPHVIEDYMKMSKGRFKKAVGYLYKLRFIEIMEEGLKLTDEGSAEAAQRFAHLSRRSENAVGAGGDDAAAAASGDRAGEHADSDAGASGAALSERSGKWADSDTGTESGFDAERDGHDNEDSSEQAESSGRADYADIDALADTDASGDSDPMVDEVVHAVARARRMNVNGGYQPPFSVDRSARSESDDDFDMERPAEAVIESSDENREEVERRAQEVLGESLEDFGDFAGRSSFNAALDNAASASYDKSEDGVYGRERRDSDRREGRRSDRREGFGDRRDDRGSRFGDRDSSRRGGFGGRRDERRDSRDGFRRDGDRRDDRRDGRESRFGDRRSGSGSFGRRDDRGFGSRRDGNREERRGSRGDRFDSRRGSFGGRYDRRDGGRDRGFGSRHDSGSRGSRFDRDSRPSRGGHAFRGQR